MVMAAINFYTDCSHAYMGRWRLNGHWVCHSNGTMQQPKLSFWKWVGSYLKRSEVKSRPAWIIEIWSGCSLITPVFLLSQQRDPAVRGFWLSAPVISPPYLLCLFVFVKSLYERWLLLFTYSFLFSVSDHISISYSWLGFFFINFHLYFQPSKRKHTTFG